MISTATQLGSYRFRLEFRFEHGQRTHQLALASADFTRAIEATDFDALRKGLLTDYAVSLSEASLEPRFLASDRGSPRASGFRVSVPVPGGQEHCVDFDADFFRSQANRVAADLSRAGQFSENTRLLYELTAFLYSEEPGQHRRSGITVEPAFAEVPIRFGSRTALGPAKPWDTPRPDDLPVLIPRRILEEAVADARQTPDREVGGILLGHVCRDTESGDLFLEITCQIPAEQTQATSTSVTFTANTWSRARAVAELRGQGEIFAGWVHSHPFRFCNECPLPTPPECVAKVLFFSEDDEFLMELSFPRPFMVGLLTAVEPRLEEAIGHLPVRLYGWHNGVLRQRGFEVVDGERRV